VSAEVFEDAAVGAADAAMGAAMAEARDEAKGETTDADAARSRAFRGRRSRVFPPLRLRGPRNQAGPSSSGRRLDTSRYCFPENRSPSTVASRSHR
jgi:hypothetical protein